MIRKKSQYVIVTTTRGTFCKSPPLIMAATLNMENGSIERGYLFFKFLWSRQMLKRQCYFIQNNNNKITNTGLSAHKALWVLSELNRLPSNFSWAMNIAMKGMELTLVLICFCLFVCLFCRCWPFCPGWLSHAFIYRTWPAKSNLRNYWNSVSCQ